MKAIRIQSFLTINKIKLELFMAICMYIAFHFRIIRLKGERAYKLFIQIPFITVTIGISDTSKKLRVV